MKTTLARIDAIENRLPFDPAHWLRTNNVLHPRWHELSPVQFEAVGKAIRMLDPEPEFDFSAWEFPQFEQFESLLRKGLSERKAYDLANASEK
jgi:hypothetical protein